MKKRRTAEEKAAWRATIDAVAGKVKAMSQEDKEAMAYGAGLVTCEGHPLTLHNACFLLTQAAGSGIVPTVIGGFQQWQRAGRMVCKGQHALGYIYAPMKRGKATPAGGSDDGAEDEAKLGKAPRQRFILVAVFDISQTEAAGVDVEAVELEAVA